MHSEATNHYYFTLSGEYKIIQELLLEASYKNSVKSDETTYLRLGGKKDEIDFKTTYYYLPSG